MGNHDRTAWLALLLGCILGFAIVFGAKLNTVTHQLKGEATQLKVQQAQIQQQRYDQVFAFCQGQNERHARTVSTLNALLVKAEQKQPKRAPQIKASEAPTLLLIDALVPVQDCKAVARATIH